jgi:hypothetical protein
MIIRYAASKLFVSSICCGELSIANGPLSGINRLRYNFLIPIGMSIATYK